MEESKKWLVEYNHADGRKGTVEVITAVGKSGAFRYGNGKCCTITVGDYTQCYDMRYVTGDLHKVMLKGFFGDGLVKATEI